MPCRRLKRYFAVKIFEVIGRKAHLTPTGEVLYRRAKALVEEAGLLERAAGSLAAGWEPELRLAVEIIFPTWLLLQCFRAFRRGAAADAHRALRNRDQRH